MQVGSFGHNVRQNSYDIKFFHFWFDLDLTTNYLSLTIYSIKQSKITDTSITN